MTKLTPEFYPQGYNSLSECFEIGKKNPGKIVLAVPVAPEESPRELESFTDEGVGPHVIGGYFGGIGAFYERFDQNTDDEVREVLWSFEGS